MCKAMRIFRQDRHSYEMLQMMTEMTTLHEKNENWIDSMDEHEEYRRFVDAAG